MLSIHFFDFHSWAGAGGDGRQSRVDGRLPPPEDSAAMPVISQSRRCLLTALLCVVLEQGGCGRNQTAPPSEGAENSPAASRTPPVEASPEQQTEQKLDPLTKDEVELYLKVMREAAARVQNSTPEDRAALEGAKKILAGSTSGRVPTQDDVKALERANLVATAMDQIVAEEMKLDGRAYRGIAEAIESVIPNPELTASSRGSAAPNPAPADHPLTPLEKRLSEVNAANEKFLALYRVEIQKLIAIVRNPANLPR
jgi:hypothetical protein